MKSLDLAIVAFAAVACGNEQVRPPAGGDCTSCSPTTSGGTTSAGTTTGGSHMDAMTSPDVVESGTDGAAAMDAGSVTVMFNVGRTNDTGFLSVSPYDSLVHVSAVGLGGAVVTTGDVTTGEGTLDGVATGANWFAVQDPGGTVKILPTLQPVQVDRVAPRAALVAVGSNQLKPLTIDQQPWAPLAGHATLIVIFNRGGKLIDGIKIGPTLPPGAGVAYEQSGAYVTPMTNPDVATDSEGTALVRDIDNVATYPMTTPIKFGYRLGTAALSFEASLAADFVTWMTVAVP